jgi:hypothetical protein
MLRRSKQVGLWLAGFAGFFLMVTVAATPLPAAEPQSPLEALKKAGMTMGPSIKVISGSVVALDKGLKGIVTSVGINTETEGTFVVKHDAKGEELKHLTGKKVEVTGAVHESEGQKIINVRSYKVLD